MDTFWEFVYVKHFIVIIICYPESPSNILDTTSTSCTKSCSHLLDDFFIREVCLTVAIEIFFNCVMVDGSRLTNGSSKDVSLSCTCLSSLGSFAAWLSLYAVATLVLSATAKDVWWSLLLSTRLFEAHCLLNWRVSFEVPGIGHHNFEIVVTVNARWNIGVVLQELFSCDDVVRRVVVAHVVSGFESLEELLQYLLLGLLALKNVGVLGTTINSLKISNF